MTDIATTTTIATDNQPATSPAPITPGWRTTEFWFALLATLLSALFASGALTNNTALAIAGMAATVLTALGYKVSRTLVKIAGVMLVVGLAGSVALAPGCATVQPRVGAGATALLDCTTTERAAVVDDLGVALRSYVLRYVSGDKQTVDIGKLKADASKLKGEVIGSCGIVAALAALATPPPFAARSLLSGPSGPEPEQWAAALAEVRAELGVGAVRAAGG